MINAHYFRFIQGEIDLFTQVLQAEVKTGALTDTEQAEL